MILHALAADYDGTLAEHGRLDPRTGQALERVRRSGRRLLLVTGRLLPDLRSVCPGLDDLFDAVVAENGALLYCPDRRQVRALGDPPEPALVSALERHGVRFVLGSSIVQSEARFAGPALAAIRQAGVERTLVFNKGALMLLPGGVTKGSGLRAALEALELSPHNLAGIGDAENDHAFLALCECAVAVADAVPALRERADHVTRAGAGAGVVEFIEEHLLHDAVTLIPRLRRHDLPLGRTAEGELPPDRSFYFTGPQGALNLRAANLRRFCELAEGVDEATWRWHLQRGDYSAWMRAIIKDPDLADEVAAVERDQGDASRSRARLLEIVRRRYTV